MSESPEEKKLVVPKFGSFKPKPVARSVPKAPTKAEAETAPSRDDGKQRSRRRSHRSHRHRDHDRRRSKSPDARESRQLVKRDRDDPVEAPPASRELVRQDGNKLAEIRTSNLGKDLFVIDTKGDPLLATYGPDRWKALQFRRARREAVLGADGYLVVHSDGPYDTFSIRRPGESSGPSLRDKNPFRHVKYTKSKTIKVQKHQSVEPAGDEFISLTSRKRKRSDEDDSSSDGQIPEYRRIEGKEKARADSDSDTGSESASSNLSRKGKPVEEDDPLKQRSIHLSRRVKTDPTDIPAWLELIDHQDILMSVGADPSEDVSASEIKSFAEIKISMFEKGLAHAKSVTDRERLLAGLVREGAKVWTDAELAKRWTSIMRDASDSFVLWRYHLEYEMAKVASFDYSQVKQVFLDRIALLKKKASDPAPTPSRDQLESLYREMLYVFLRTTRYLYDAGYIELSVAAWQTLLELNFMGGEDTAISETAISAAFSEFWEAEVPRIGETGARGWGHFVKGGGDLDAPGPRPADDETTGPESRDGYKNWAWQELRRAKAARMPARTLDEGTEDDPFRVVMYSDLDGLPFMIPPAILPFIKTDIFDAFLIFCRLPPIRLSRDWEADSFLAPEDKGLDTKVSSAAQSSAGPDGEHPRRSPTYLAGRITPAVFPRYLCAVIEWGEGYRGHHKPLDFTWILLTLKQLVQRGEDELGMYYLALEWLRDADSIKKAAKPLVKKYPSNLEFYNLYGLLEWANNNTTISHNVLRGATQLSEPSESGIRNPLPWFSWAWAEFIEKRPVSSVLARLCSAVNVQMTSENLTPVHLLTASKAFSSNFEKLLSEGQAGPSVLAAKCWAFLEYLAPSTTGTEPQSDKQGNISAAMDTTWQCSLKLLTRGDNGAAAAESLLDFAATLLYTHATRGPYRRPFLCDNLQKAVKIFPRNTFYLSLFSWADSSLRIRSDLHHALHEYVLVGPNDGVPVRICAITHELVSGTVYSARAAFEKSLNSEAAKSSAPLWVAYIRFCHAREELRAKAKEVYYRALARCPWSKEVVMEGFTTLVRDMESTELRAAFNGMSEKGLRVHIDLGEFIERKKRETKAKNERPRKDRK